MQTWHTLQELRRGLQRHRQQGQQIAIVPTMGNLHQGHLRLVEKARELADVVVTTIFVNPLQFSGNEDLDKYPRTLPADSQKLDDAGCHYLFAPSVAEMYPRGMAGHTLVTVPGISERHCGASRPGHFDGVATVVTKLFNMVQPDHAIFGRKDYQQLLVIRKVIEDLALPIQLHGIPTERDDNGLALSSRNGYLDAAERTLALVLQQTLQTTAQRIRAGERDYAALEAAATQHYLGQGLRPDYFHICQADTLEPATAADHHLVILTAAFVGTTRLIDNLELTFRSVGRHLSDRFPAARHKQ